MCHCDTNLDFGFVSFINVKYKLIEIREFMLPFGVESHFFLFAISEYKD